MSARAPEAGLSGPARWACVAALGGLGAIGVARGFFKEPPPEPASQALPPVRVTLPAREREPAPNPVQTAPAASEPAISAAPAQEPAAAPAASAPDAGIQKLVNVNTASAEELQLLPGIGPVMAQRLIEDRAANGPYKSPADLDRVKGIGPKTLEKLTPLVRFD